jgi:hypothetical protein
MKQSICLTTGDCHVAIGYVRRPAFRPSGHISCVQNRSKRFCLAMTENIDVIASEARRSTAKLSENDRLLRASQ